MADRAALAAIATLLRDARDRLEVANEPFDARLGNIQTRLHVLINDLRTVPITPPIMGAA